MSTPSTENTTMYSQIMNVYHCSATYIPNCTNSSMLPAEVERARAVVAIVKWVLQRQKGPDRSVSQTATPVYIMHHFVSSIVQAPPSYPLLPLASLLALPQNSPPDPPRRGCSRPSVLRCPSSIASSPSLPARAMP